MTLDGTTTIQVGGDHELRIRRATARDWPTIHGWAAAEGWNPGLLDHRAFLAADPDGFFLGLLGDTPVSAISVVNYCADYAHLGHYLVAQPHRGRGLGLATWTVGLAHAEGRVIALDAVDVQVDTYRTSGFVPLWRTVRYSGPLPELTPGRHLTHRLTMGPAQCQDVDEIARYDATGFPAFRTEFLRQWLTAAHHLSQLARDESGAIAGYGVARPAVSGWRIGPLTAEDPDTAAVLLDTLCRRAKRHGATQISMDVPGTTPAAAELAVARGLAPDFTTTRMLRGTPHEGHTPDPSLTYALASLELG